MDEKEQILDNFDHSSITRYELHHNYVETYYIEISNKHAKYGEKSLALNYHFGGWRKGNGAMYIKFRENLVAKKRPFKFGLWVYGDGKSPWLRATFIDGLGDRKIVNLTERNIDWTGWKYLDTIIDASLQLPIKLDYIYAVEVNKMYQGDANYGGVIYFDQLRFVYIDDIDLKGPVFSDILPEEDYIYSDTFTFKAKVKDDMTGVDPDTINVRVNGDKIAHYFSGEYQTINCYFEYVKEGCYHLSVTAKDYAGNISTPGLEKTINVDLSPDYEKPFASNITPTENATVYTNTPRITFHLFDYKSGVEESAIDIRLNGIKVDYLVYDEKTGWGYALSDKKLAFGMYTFTIYAEDRAGNRLGPIKNKFHVSPIGQPRNKNEFNLTIIPDTHSIDYSQLALSCASNDISDVVLHMGDMVDQGTEDEFQSFKRSTVDLLKNKRLLTVPGNHESFSENLDSYMHYFGSPTYHLEYGNLLFIALNSSYEQSISASDSTQFLYLKHLLKNNDKDNILIATHVPTRDDFGTAHAMKEDDGAELEQILGDYKKKYKNVNVTVLFGHLHVLHHWEDNGISYTITGNGAEKSYVGDNQKKILGHGILTVSAKGLIYEYKPYLNTIKITYKNHHRSELYMKHGSFQRLGLQGKCHILNSRNKIIDLSNIDLINKRWFTSNKSVVKVHENGLIEARNKGKSIISAIVNGLKSTIKIVVV